MKQKIFKLLVKISQVTGINKLIIKLYSLSQNKPIILTHKDKVFGEFTDSFGNTFKLHSQIRDLIKPGWRSMFQPAAPLKPLANNEVAKKLGKWNEKLIKVESYLNAHSLTLKNVDAMEIGAFDGSFVYALANFGAKKVVGTDIAAYYVSSTPGKKVTQEEVDIQNNHLASLRNSYANQINHNKAANASFKEDNIFSSSIESNSKDVIFSWEVLEHLSDPEKAFSEMARILKPGGFAFHEYNPFFSIIGGHSLCTLDFFWGHARLNNSDFEKYIDQYRKNEKELALNFFLSSLNRMTLSDLKFDIEKSGLTPVNILPIVNEEHMRYVNKDILSQVKASYPTVKLEDLISPFVWVIFQKK